LAGERRRLSDRAVAAARDEQLTEAAGRTRTAYGELQRAVAVGDAAGVERLTGRLGEMVAGLRSQGVSVVGIAGLVGAPTVQVRRWLRATGGGR
jgi:hypothetical protein